MHGIGTVLYAVWGVAALWDVAAGPAKRQRQAGSTQEPNWEQGSKAPREQDPLYARLRAARHQGSRPGIDGVLRAGSCPGDQWLSVLVMPAVPHAVPHAVPDVVLHARHGHGGSVITRQKVSQGLAGHDGAGPDAAGHDRPPRFDSVAH